LGECFTQCFTQRFTQCMGECFTQRFSQRMGECFTQCFTQCVPQCLGECFTQLSFAVTELDAQRGAVSRAPLLCVCCLLSTVCCLFLLCQNQLPCFAVVLSLQSDEVDASG